MRREIAAALAADWARRSAIAFEEARRRKERERCDDPA